MALNRTLHDRSGFAHAQVRVVKIVQLKPLIPDRRDRLHTGGPPEIRVIQHVEGEEPAGSQVQGNAAEGDFANSAGLSR